ncbi:LysR family transcriptional regulator [Chitinimonas sp.]|uniref:LysR family transcriptional regulator n=1 Tax=Chitinimonas sp. TaxID=1934313 RepID=UPI0035AE5EC9
MPAADLNRLSLFATVVDCGGFTAAAAQLGMAKSQISQQISRLEAQLGVTLLLRTTRKVVPTEAGLALHAEIVPALQALSVATASLGADQGRLEGRLRLTAPADYATGPLAGHLARFAMEHPALELELIATDKVLDLVGEGIDLAIRAGFLRDSSMRAQRLDQFAQLAVVAPALWQKAGCPTRPEALQGAPWVALTVLPSPLAWRFSHDADEQHCAIKARSVFRANSANVARECARSGLGWTVLPDYMVADDIASGRLLTPLQGWSLPIGGVYAVYPASRFLPAKVRRLIGFLKAVFEVEPP